MYARIGVWQGSRDELEGWTARCEAVKESVAREPGSKGGFFLRDAENRKALTITLWESEEALRASEEARSRIQAGTTAASGAKVTTERYEVVDRF
jgi:heme-degrading monooxygenase HmoA